MKFQEIMALSTLQVRKIKYGYQIFKKVQFQKLR